MKTIWKFPLEVGHTSVEMPVGGRLLDVQTQDETPYLWALVDKTNSPEVRCFLVRGTGHPIDGDEGEYIGTFQLLGGAFIGHVFEVSP